MITRISLLIELKPVIVEWNCSGVLSRSSEWKEKNRKRTSGLVYSWPGPQVEVNYVTSVNHPKQHEPFSFYRNCNVSFPEASASKTLRNNATSLSDGPLPGLFPYWYLATKLRPQLLPLSPQRMLIGPVISPQAETRPDGSLLSKTSATFHTATNLVRLT